MYLPICAKRNRKNNPENNKIAFTYRNKGERLGMRGMIGAGEETVLNVTLYTVLTFRNHDNVLYTKNINKLFQSSRMKEQPKIQLKQ